MKLHKLIQQIVADLSLHKLLILWNVFIGYLIKWKIDIFGCRKLAILNNKEQTFPKLIVSLTSYGRRVSSGVVYYTLISLLKQRKTPDRIILWLAADEWNDDTVPHRLKSLYKYGVEIRFCVDIRSYKKLIPTLLECPNDIIVTVDDDIYYSSYFLESLYSAYLQDKKRIYCTTALAPSFNVDGKIKPYNNWIQHPDSEDPFLFPVGVGGVLYPPNSLYRDVCRQDLFMNLCPLADDIWFWVMALKQGTDRCCVRNGIYKNYSFDSLYQYFHKGSALTHANCKLEKNDYQLAKVLECYNIIFEIERKGISTTKK